MKEVVEQIFRGHDLGSLTPELAAARLLQLLDVAGFAIVPKTQNLGVHLHLDRDSSRGESS